MADMIEFPIPGHVAVTINDASTGQTLQWTFEKTAQWVVDTHPLFNQTGPGIRQGGRILAAIIGSDEKSKPLSREDAEAFGRAMNEPANGWMPTFYNVINGQQEKAHVPARNFLPYIDAVEGALASKGEAK